MTGIYDSGISIAIQSTQNALPKLQNLLHAVTVQLGMWLLLGKNIFIGLVHFLNTFSMLNSIKTNTIVKNYFDVPVMKGRKWYSLKKELRPFITGTSICIF